MLQDRRWDDVQDAIRSDPALSMRIDDDSARSLDWSSFAASSSSMAEIVDVDDNDDGARYDGAGGDGGDGDDENVANSSHRNDDARLRYWVGNNDGGRYGFGGDGEHAHASSSYREAHQRRTLLHALCRMGIPAVGIPDADADLEGAVRTASMLIAASHDCPARMLPPVERRCHEEEDDDGDYGEMMLSMTTTTTEMVRHTSVLTMTDIMGETPLHSLTGVGSCHIDLVRTFVKACRHRGRDRRDDLSSPLDGSYDGDDCTEGRRPTAYDLLVAQNYHGCTPLHFLAGGSYIISV